MDQGFIIQDQFAKLLDLADFTSRLLAKFINNYKQKGYKGQRFQAPINHEAEQFEAYLKSIVDPSKRRHRFTVTQLHVQKPFHH